MCDRINERRKQYMEVQFGLSGTLDSIVPMLITGSNGVREVVMVPRSIRDNYEKKNCPPPPVETKVEKEPAESSLELEEQKAKIAEQAEIISRLMYKIHTLETDLNKLRKQKTKVEE